MPGHLFITRGDLLSLSCDAILVPSGLNRGKRWHVAPHWRDLELPLDEGRFLQPTPRHSRRVTKVRDREGANPAVWLAHTGESGRDPSWHAEVIPQFVAAAGRARTSAPRPLADDRPLLAVPLVGTQWSGQAHNKGAMVREVVIAALETVRTTQADVVLVLNHDGDHAAAQQARSRYLDAWPPFVEERRRDIARLAHEALAGHLVLFVGAGIGIGAGLPSWSGLLDQLAARADLSDLELRELHDMDNRDAGALLEQRLGRTALTESIAEIVGGSKVSLFHQLLAALPTTEALTTNYDALLERAFADAGRPATVLPRARRARGRWLLKLHGSVDDQRRMVLSRGDYLRFEGREAALAGIVQAMLLTRHLLFVGYSLGDDNFHRIVQQVRDAVGAGRGGRGRLGTVMTPDPPSLASELWERDLAFVSTAGGEGAVRRMAILLDRLGSETSPPGKHLLDPTYERVFRPEELEVRDQLRNLHRAVSSKRVRPALRRAVLDALRAFEDT